MIQSTTEKHSESSPRDSLNLGDGDRRQGRPCPVDPPQCDGGAMSIADRTDALIRGLEFVLAHHCASARVLVQLREQLTLYLGSTSDEMVWCKYVKHVLSYPLARYLRSDLPPPPADGHVFQASSVLRRWMKSRLIAFNRRNTHLWYSWFQAKRSALPMSEDVVEKTYQEHLTSLTREDPGDDSVIAEIFNDETFRLVLERIRAAVLHAAPTIDSCIRGRTSGSASFEATRSRGGQHATLRRVAGLQSEPLDLCGSDLSSMQFREGVYTSRALPPVQPSGWASGTFNCPGWEQMDFDYPQDSVPIGREDLTYELREEFGREMWEELPSKLRHTHDFSRPLACTIQAVLEPMKVRVISKGESLPYYASRGLQRAMHTAMRSMECFRLIGRPFSPTDLVDLKESSSTSDEWFSIDYSAATDGLSWKYSGRILQFLLSGLPAQFQSLCMQVLGPHKLYYPVRGGHKEFRGVQRNGQLMGSILSFPILCLANLGVYLRVTRDDQKTWPHEARLRHVLVNGDDMLYASDVKRWDDHVRIGSAVGLSMSVGKAYHHSVYSNINSTSVHYSLSDFSASPWQIDFLNTGLCFGQHKVLDKYEGGVVEPGFEAEYAQIHARDCKDSIVPNLNSCLKGSLPGRQHSLLKWLLTEHREQISADCRVRYASGRGFHHRNLFLPHSVGGCGVDVPVGWKFHISPTDIRVARHYRDSGVGCVTTQRPLPGWAIEGIERRLPPWEKPQLVAELEVSDRGPRTNRGRGRERGEYLLGLFMWAPHPAVCA